MTFYKSFVYVHRSWFLSCFVLGDLPPTLISYKILVVWQKVSWYFCVNRTMGREGESVCPAIEFWCLPVTDDFLSSSVRTLLIHPMTIYSPALSAIKPNPIMSHFLWALFSFYEVQYVLDKSYLNRFLNPKCWETCVFPKSRHVPLVNCPANICKYSAIMAGPAAAAAGCWPPDLRFVQNSRLWMLWDRLRRAPTLHSPDWSQWGLRDANLWKLWNILNNQSYYPPCLSLWPGPDIDTVLCNLLTDKMGHSIVLALALVWK